MHYVVGIPTTLSAQPSNAELVTAPYSGTGRTPAPKPPTRLDQ